MFTDIYIMNLLLDLGNDRCPEQVDQKGALDALIRNQGKKLTKLAEDIIENGLNPCAPLKVVHAQNHDLKVIAGKQRLAAMQPLLAQGKIIDCDMVCSKNENQKYIVIDGNQRLAAILLMLIPKLAQGTKIHEDFVRLNQAHAVSSNDSVQVR